MKYIFIIALSLIIVSLAILGMSYLVNPPQKSIPNPENIELTHIENLNLLNIKGIKSVHKKKSYEKIKSLPPILLDVGVSNMPVISKVKSTDKSFKLPDTVDFKSSDCKYCHQ